MLTHIVTVALTPEATAEQVDALVTGLEGLPSEIEAIGTYRVGRDLGLFPGNAELVIVATFATEDDVRTYIDHPAHQGLVRDLLDPVSAHRQRIQIEGV